MTDSELRGLIAETFRGIAELREFQQKVDEQMKKTDEQMKKTDERMKKTDERMKRTDEKIEKIAQMIGGISNNQGAVAEEFFYNSLKHNQELGGIKYDFIDKNVTRAKGKIEDEFDILMINGKDVAIIETKYKAHKNDLEKLINKKHNNFKELFPMYKEYNHHLVLASFHINDDLKEEALNKGVMVLQRRGNMVEVFENSNIENIYD